MSLLIWLSNRPQLDWFNFMCRMKCPPSRNMAEREPEMAWAMASMDSSSGQLTAMQHAQTSVLAMKGALGKSSMYAGALLAPAPSKSIRERVANALANTEGSAALGARNARLSAKHAQMRELESSSWMRNIFNKKASAAGMGDGFLNDCSKLAAIKGWMGLLDSRSMEWVMESGE